MKLPIRFIVASIFGCLLMSTGCGWLQSQTAPKEPLLFSRSEISNREHTEPVNRNVQPERRMASESIFSTPQEN